MKIAEVAFALLVFNVCMAIVSHSLITPYPIYYEAEYVNTFQPEGGSIPDNISTVSEDQQYSTTMEGFNVILTVTDFGWLRGLVPEGLKDAADIYITGIQAIVGFFYLVALLELFLRRTGVIGGSDN